jgi:hypothetical protein
MMLAWAARGKAVGQSDRRAVRQWGVVGVIGFGFSVVGEWLMVSGRVVRHFTSERSSSNLEPGCHEAERRSGARFMAGPHPGDPGLSLASVSVKPSAPLRRSPEHVERAISIPLCLYPKAACSAATKLCRELCREPCRQSSRQGSRQRGSQIRATVLRGLRACPAATPSSAARSKLSLPSRPARNQNAAVSCPVSRVTVTNDQ